MDVSSDDVNFDNSDNGGLSPRQAPKTAKGRALGEQELTTPEKASASPAAGKARAVEGKKTLEKSNASARASGGKMTPDKPKASTAASEGKKIPEKAGARPSTAKAQEKKTSEKPSARPTTAKAQEKKTPEKANAPARASDEKKTPQKPPQKTPQKTNPSTRVSQEKKTPEKANARPSAGTARASEEKKIPEKPSASARASGGKKTPEKASTRLTTAKARTSEEKQAPKERSVPNGKGRDDAAEESLDTSSDSGPAEEQIPPKIPKKPAAKAASGPHQSKKSTVVEESDSGTEEDQIPPKKSKRPAVKVASGARGSKMSTLVPESGSRSEKQQIPSKKPKGQVAKAVSDARHSKNSIQVEEAESESGTDEEEIAPKKAKNPVTKAPSGTHQPKKASLINDLKDLKSEDMIPTPQKSRKLKRSSSSELQGGAKRRSLTRNAVEPKKVNYDVKYHPMDKATRPNARATRRVKEEFEEDQDVEDGDEEEADEERDAEADDEATPTRMALRGRRGKKANYDMTAHPLNPHFQTKDSSRKSSSKAESPAVDDNLMAFPDSVGDSWDELDPADKRLHDLQEGAPDDSNALPLKWSEVVSKLVEEGYFTKRQFTRWGGVSALRERYEEIRQAAQGQYADLEPKDRDDRHIYYQEGFDVFDLEGLDTVYVNPNIPEYMRGMRNFTAKDIAKYEQEFNNARNSVTADSQDTGIGSSSATKPNKFQKVVITLGEPEESDAFDTPDKKVATLLKSEIRRMDAMNEHLLSTEDVAMATDDSGQAPPAKALLSRSASAAGTATESPSRSRKAKALVAPIASMTAPLTKENLAEDSIAATKAFLSSPPPKPRDPSSSINLIDSLTAGSGAEASNQLLSELKPPTIFGKIVAETIPGSTKKQLKRGKRKITAASTTDFQIHEDTPGNTPQGKPRRDAITLETLKENMPEEWEDAQPRLDALTAQYDAGQAGREAAGAAEARQRTGTLGASGSSPDTLNVSSPSRPSGSLSGVIPSVEDSITVAAAASPSAAARARGIDRGISVVIPRFMRESRD